MLDKRIHDYFGVDLWAVWGVAEHIIPTLDKQIEEILQNDREI